MVFSKKIAKIGRGKFVNGYKREGGEIVFYLNSNGLAKRGLSDDGGSYKLKAYDFENINSEILPLEENLYVCRMLGTIKVIANEL